LSEEETPLTPDEPTAESADTPSEPTGAPVEEPAAESAPSEVAEEPAGDAPSAEEPASEAPTADAPEAPAADAPEAPAADAPEAPAAPAAEAPAADAPEAPAADAPEPPTAQTPAPQAPAASDEAEEELPETPRQKPEIPGLELEPDLAPEEEYLDAEARAAAEAEAEAAAARARAEAEDEQARPIADAAIDLAAGARYTATGKRKTAVARVIVKPGTGEYSINGKPLNTFFPRETLQRMIRQPLEAVGYESRMDVVARMHGGGVSSQAGALRHGISRALIEADPNLRGELKRRGFLTRDPRVKERKKAGLKKARKRPQFSKR
jgi:small subunit ribosomal protein S9